MIDNKELVISTLEICEDLLVAVRGQLKKQELQKRILTIKAALEQENGEEQLPHSVEEINDLFEEAMEEIDNAPKASQEYMDALPVVDTTGGETHE